MVWKKNYRGQSYDNASYMSSKYNSLHSEIISENKLVTLKNFRKVAAERCS